jgi:cyclopropane-fatty-acyl-phospholipid synthase
MELLATRSSRPSPSLTARLLARQLRGWRYGSLDLEIDGQCLHFEGSEPGPAGHMLVDRPLRLLRRVAVGGSLGLAESYLAGDWQSNDLAPLLWALALNEEALGKQDESAGLPGLVARLRHRLNANSRRGSRRNIAYHYDLGNDFYRLWLDSGMSYSAAVFADEDEAHEQAQERKYARMLELAGARPGQHVLEIGCGWGGFVDHATRRGMDITGITLSREQLAWASRRADAAGVADRTDLKFLDYRELSGRFDHIVSVEMFEAVGERYWGTFMHKVRECLKPGGRAALQVITIAEDAFARYRERADFIQRYIFPGGMLPSVQAFDRAAAEAGLRVVRREFGGLDYARTLARWHTAFERCAAELARMGFDERFRRMWRYYFAYCEAGFRSGRIDLMRVALEPA